MQRFITWDTIEARVDGAKLNALAASFRVDPIERMELQFFNGLLRVSGSIRKFISVPFTVDIREILPSGHTVRVPIASASAFGGLPIPLLHGAAFTMGASASIFGLLGALVHYGRTSGSSFIHGQAMRYAVILFIFGLIMPGVDNYAHAGGFAGGYITSAFFNPLTRERGDHMLAAVACLFATLLAILFSVVHGLGIV